MRYAHLAISVFIFTVVSLWIALDPAFGVFDSLTHWGAIQLFLRGEDPYNFEALRALLDERMRNVPVSQRIGGHPWTLTFMIPFYAWPFTVSKFLLAFTNLSLYHLCIRRLRTSWSPLPPFTPLLMWVYIPFLATMYFGQFSVFLVLGTVLLIEWIQSPDRPWWKWTVAMTLLAIKPQGFIVAAPLLALEFLRTSSAIDKARAIGTFSLMALLSAPLLAYFPEWTISNRFSHQHRSATLSSYARDVGQWLGYDSPLWLWALPIISLTVLLACRVRIKDPIALLLVFTLSELTAPYIWVYDSCALMPLFYALIGASVAMKTHRWRWCLGIVFTSISIFPIYLAIDPDFSFMRMHNVCLAIAAVLLLPGVRGYLKRQCDA